TAPRLAAARAGDRRGRAHLRTDARLASRSAPRALHGRLRRGAGHGGHRDHGAADAGRRTRARRTPPGWLFLTRALLAYIPVSGVVPVYPAIAQRALFTPEHFLYLPLLGLAPLIVGSGALAWPPSAAAG